MRRILSLFLSAALCAGAVPAGATAVRVETIGQTLLLPDAEGDLGQISSFLHDIGDRRLFGRGTWTRELTESTSDDGTFRSEDDRTDSVSASVQYVHGGGAYPFALKYSPSYRESVTEEFEEGVGTSFETFRSRDSRGLQAMLGFGLGTSMKGGVAAFHSELYERRDDSTAGSITSKGQATGAEASLVAGKKGGARLFVSAAALAGTADVTAGSSATSGTHESLRGQFTLVPEFPVGAETLWRLLAAFSPVRTEITIDGSPDYGTKLDDTWTFGAGWTRGTTGDLWHADLLIASRRESERNVLAGPPLVKTKTQTTAMTCRLGLEKPMGSRFIGRAGADLLTYRGVKEDSTAGNARDFEGTFDFNPSQVIGLGYKAGESLLLDVSLSRLSGQATSHDFKDTGAVEDGHGATVNIDFGVEYKFR